MGTKQDGRLLNAARKDGVKVSGITSGLVVTIILFNCAVKSFQIRFQSVDHSAFIAGFAINGNQTQEIANNVILHETPLWDRIWEHYAEVAFFVNSVFSWGFSALMEHSDAT
jgi:hypothetical protein